MELRQKYLEADKETQILRDLVELYFEIDNVYDLSRERKLVDARKVFAYILRTQNWSLNKIGRALKKDHTTIIHYLKDMEWLLQHDSSIIHAVKIISKSWMDEFNEYLDQREMDEPTIIVHLKEENKELKKEIDRLKKSMNIFSPLIDEVPSHKLQDFYKIAKLKIRRIINGL
mgnify:CR=1 FL=1|tara:strand:- start:367 stop:885 length:519 start_codon:yes stop_codon:yes gene_type:complete